MLGRSPGECHKGQHAPTWRKAADDQLAAYTDVPACQKHQAVEPVAVCTSGSLTSGSKDDAEVPTGRAVDRQKTLDFGAMEFVDLENDALEDVGGVHLVFDVIGGDIAERSAGLVRAGETLVSTAWRSISLSSPIVPNWVTSCSGCVTDGCGRVTTSATSRPSTMLSRHSTRPSDAMGRRSSAFVREDSGQRPVLPASWISAT